MNEINTFKNGSVVWLMGLSGAGKTTLSVELYKKFTEAGVTAIVLDGDTLRAGINKDLGYDNESRAENIRRAAEMAKTIANHNVLVICSLITPKESDRQIARSILKGKLVEVYVNCPLALCEERDLKGLYKRARAGEIKNFTGFDSPFEIPINADIIIDTSKESVSDCAITLYENVSQLLSNQRFDIP